LDFVQVVDVDDARFDHLVVEVVAFTGPFAHAREHRIARVHLGDVVDQFHDQNGLAHAGAAEQADLAALGIGGQQVDHLDAGHQDGDSVACSAKSGAGWWIARSGGHDRALFVDRLADDVQDAAQRGVAHRHRDRRAGVGHRGAAHQTFGRVHGDGADGVFAQVLRHFQNQPLAVVVGFSAFRIAGRSPSNCTSTTAPITCVTLPFAFAMSFLRFRQSASAPEMISISSLVIAA
jgi:hypothetical protein